MKLASMFTRRRWRSLGLAAAMVAGVSVVAAPAAYAGDETFDYSFSFVNGVTIDGSASDKTAVIAGAGGSSATAPTGMTVHLSCSDMFSGGWGEKDGPRQSVDTAWQLDAFRIDKIKDGAIDKTCSGDDLTSTPPSGDGIMYSFTFVNGAVIDGMSDGNTAFLPNAGGPSADNPTGMNVHVSCSDTFPGGWGEKDGPDQADDSAWQVASYSIKKFKDGKVDKTCGDDFGPPTPVGSPAIDIEKSVNGVDADTPTGPEVNVGDTVTFGYVVTNTGDVALSDVTVVDNTLGPVTCPKTTLAVGESMACDEHTEVVTQTGQMFMDATVTAVGPTGAPGITDPIPGSGSGRLYSFSFVNGTTLSGQAPNDNTYFLAGAGGTSADNPTGMNVHTSCSDEFPGGWGEKDGPEQGVDTAWQLSAYEIIKYKDGKEDKRCGDQFAPINQTVTDTDPVHFIAVDPPVPAIDIEKAVNGHDADTPPGPTFNVGDTVTFSYVVTNTGDTVVNNITVTDNTLGAVNCPLTTLAVGESMSCDEHSETLTVAGAIYMDATVTGTSPDDVPVTDTDPVNFKVVKVGPGKPAVDIEKSVNGYDADEATGPDFFVGDELIFEYVVTNVGNTTLVDLTVTDTVYGPIACPKTTLLVGETMDCGPVHAIATHLWTNVMKSTVVGFSPGGIEVSDLDLVYFFVYPVW